MQALERSWPASKGPETASERLEPVFGISEPASKRLEFVSERPGLIYEGCEGDGRIEGTYRCGGVLKDFVPSAL